MVFQQRKKQPENARCSLRIADCALKIADVLAPMREKRAYYEKNLTEVTDILADGEKRAHAEAQTTMKQVREVMKIG